MKIAAGLAALALAAPTAIRTDATSLGVGYICSAENPPPPAGSKGLVMFPGMGTGAFPVDSANREAQAWFDYGVKLYHAFNHEEAKQAFAKAVSLDPTCARCAWGEALSLGPTLNYTISPSETEKALAAADRAAGLAKPDDAKARALIAALQLRYAKVPAKEGSEVAYGRAMDELTRRFPDDDEIAELTAHALLTPARYDDYSGVPRAIALLEPILARKPDDTAAIHYYIHATEFAGHAATALPYAKRLADLAPGASHLVHMGAHTMMRVGFYQEVAVKDAAALKVDADFKAAQGLTVPASDQRYYLHNFQFGLAGALMSGDQALALKFADHAGKAFTQAPVDRRVTAASRSLVALGRYAPERALAVPENPGDKRIQKIYRHYARGEALASRGDAAAVQREADAVARLGAEASAAAENGSVQIAGIAAKVLAGRAAMLQGRPAQAADLYAQAAAAQEKAFPVLRNFDPPPWWYPVRRSTAAAYLKAGRYADAEREAKASLVDWPQDALALRVLSQAERKLGRVKAADTHIAEARRAWEGDLRKVPIDLT
jgi:tetratricopeptide (TPR) repeat protein